MRIYLVPLSLIFVYLALAQAEPPEPASGGIVDHWRDLAGPDAAKAYRAIWALTKTPKETVVFIAEQLKPTATPDPRQVERLLDDLNSETFALREKANQEMTKLGSLVESALRKKLAANPSLETRQRVEKLVNRLLGPLTLPDHLRAVRAVETLETIASDDAKTLLTKYAAGAVGARLTQDAKDAVIRLKNMESTTFEVPTSRTDLYGDALPLGAVGRLGTVRFRRDEVYFNRHGLAFLPDGKRLVTASGEHEIQVWDFPSGRLRHEITTRPLYIRGFALSPDGKQFAVAGFYPSVGNVRGTSEIRVVDLLTGNVIKTFPRTAGDAFQVEFSPDGKLLFSLSHREGILRIEEIVSGIELAQKKVPTDSAGSMAVSKDGTYVALSSGPNTGKLFLWRWRNEEPRSIDLPAGRRIGSVAFSPDSKRLAVIEDFGGLFVLDVASHRLVFRQESSDDGFFFLGRPAFTSDGKTLAVLQRAGSSTFRGKIQLFDPMTGRSQGTLDTGAVGGALAFAPDARTLAVTSGSGLRLWDIKSRQEISPTDGAHQGGASNIVVSPKGFLVTAGDDGSIRLWDGATTKQRWKFQATDWVRALALSPDASLVAASSLEDAVHVLQSCDGREIYRLAGHGRLGGRRVLGFLGDGLSLISWGDDHQLRVWEMKTGKARQEHLIRPKGTDLLGEENAKRGRGKFEFDLLATAFSSDAKTLLWKVGGNFHLFDTSTGNETSMFASGGSHLDSLAVSPDGKYLLVSSSGDRQVGKHPVAIVDLSSGSTVQRLLVPGAGAGRVAFAPDGRTFATTVDDPVGGIVLHETASGNVRATIRGFRGRVQALTFFPDGHRLASGQTDSTVLLWDLAAPEHSKGPPP